MVGKVPTKPEIASAIEFYCQKYPDLKIEKSYAEPTDSWHLKDVNGVKVIIGPGFTCTDASLLAALREIVTDARESNGVESPRKVTSPSDKAIMPVKARSIDVGQMATSGGKSARSVQAIQAMQAGKDLIYVVNKKEAPTANLALMAATDANINLREIDKTHTDAFVSSTIRATLPNGRYAEATVSIMKQDFINLLAWKAVQEQEILKNDILDDADPMNIALPNGFPRLKADATISSRVKDGQNSVVIKRKAITEIYIKIMNQWIFQQRQCQTKAKRNAIIQLLTSSGQPMQTMEPEELADEQMERELVEAA